MEVLVQASDVLLEAAYTGILMAAGHRVYSAPDWDAARRALTAGRVDVLVLDSDCALRAHAILEELQGVAPAVHVILVRGGAPGPEEELPAICCEKPVTPETLQEAIARLV